MSSDDIGRLISLSYNCLQVYSLFAPLSTLNSLCRDYYGYNNRGVGLRGSGVGLRGSGVGLRGSGVGLRGLGGVREYAGLGAASVQGCGSGWS